MARNGSGVYSPPTGNPVSNGQTITDTLWNTLVSDLGNELTNSLPRDGQAPPTANLPMGNYHHTGVSDASARTQYCTAGQAQDNALDWLTSVAGTDTITAAAIMGFAAYVTGITFRFVAAATNTGAVTININGLGAVSVHKYGNAALVAGDLVYGDAYEIIYTGSVFRVIAIPYPAATQAEMNAGTEGGLRAVSPAVITSLGLKSFGLGVYTGNATLTATDFGRACYYNSASAGVLTLPAVSAGTVGMIISVFNLIATNGVCTIARAGSDVIFAQGYGSATSITLAGGDGVTLICAGGGAWVQFGGSKSRAIGEGQTWQTVTRTINSIYTNDTLRPISFSTAVTMTGTGTATIVINESLIIYGSSVTAAGTTYVTAIIPAGATYRVSATNGTVLVGPVELR
jgi:hypothetical protein